MDSRHQLDPPLSTHHPSPFFALASSSGANGTGQIPDIPNLSQLIDVDTPSSAQTFTSQISGDSFHIVFSDEFEVEGRTFWPGDDPFWEAVDLWVSILD